MTLQEQIKTDREKILIPGVTPPSQTGTYETINQFFEDQNERERTLSEAREKLGEAAKDLTDNQVFDLVVEVQYLVDSWMEEYEKNVFEGKTLDELIKI